MELKLEGDNYVTADSIVLIVPLWNWNDKHINTDTPAAMF